MSMGEETEGVKLEFWGIGKGVGISLAAGIFAWVETAFNC